jgi:hypothetical protein
MVSHKNWYLKVNEDFVILLTSKLNTCYIDGFASGMKSQSICLFTNWKCSSSRNSSPFYGAGVDEVSIRIVNDPVPTGQGDIGTILLPPFGGGSTIVSHYATS